MQHQNLSYAPRRMRLRIRLFTISKCHCWDNKSLSVKCLSDKSTVDLGIHMFDSQRIM